MDDRRKAAGGSLLQNCFARYVWKMSSGRPHIHAVLAYVIPSEHHVAVPDNEQIVFAEAPDGPPDRGRINDTRVTLP